MTRLKNEIAPKNLSFSSNEIYISDKYMTILTIVAYPRTMGVGYLSNITVCQG
jgi:hypothetical protein